MFRGRHPHQRIFIFLGFLLATQTFGLGENGRPVQAPPSEFSDPNLCTFMVAGAPADPALVAHLRNHGSHTLSYSAFQAGMAYFSHQQGAVAYEKKWLKRLVLGDPIASAEALPEVIDAFLAESPDPFFCAISHDTAVHLSKRGFLINELGKDMRLDISTFNLEGPKKAKLRQSYKKFLGSGYTIKELKASESPIARRLPR